MKFKKLLDFYLQVFLVSVISSLLVILDIHFYSTKGDIFLASESCTDMNFDEQQTEFQGKDTESKCDMPCLDQQEPTEDFSIDQVAIALYFSLSCVHHFLTILKIKSIYFLLYVKKRDKMTSPKKLHCRPQVVSCTRHH